jgi:hypothetical protein
MSNSQPVAGLVVDGKQFQLLAGGDGASFILVSKADFYTAHLQGEDAARFQSDYEAIRSCHPAWMPDQALAQLWDQGGYSWHAAQEAE